ncbi:unnamed protein product, partial [Timema podura]|nr:unnamed protein product [Timema podura]
MEQKRGDKQRLGRIAAGHVCGDERDLINGKPTGSVRVSFGYMSTKEDVDRVLRMITTCFLEEPVINKIPDWWPLHVEMYRKKFHNSLKPPTKIVNFYKNGENLNYITVDIAENKREMVSNVEHKGTNHTQLQEETIETPLSATNAMKLTHIFLYPVKSCGALSVSSWSIGPRGLLYDREWMITTPAGVSLTQKQDTKLCLIKPNIQLDKDQLCLDFPGMSQVCVSLSTPSVSKGRSEVSLCQSKVCGDRVQGYDCGDEVAQWLSDALCRDGLRLIRQQDSDTRAVKADKKTNPASGTGKKPALSLSNQAQFLLVNDCSIDWLKEQLEDSAEYSQVL